MPKFACVCGYVINLSNGTSESELTLVPDRIIEDVGDMISKGGISAEVFYNAIDPGSVTVYRCPKCERLHLEEGGRNKFRSYIRE